MARVSGPGFDPLAVRTVEIRQRARCSALRMWTFVFRAGAVADKNETVGGPALWARPLSFVSPNFGLGLTACSNTVPCDANFSLAHAVRILKMENIVGFFFGNLRFTCRFILLIITLQNL